MSAIENSDEDVDDFDALQNMLDEADHIVLELLPEKSKAKYKAVHQKFVTWRNEKKIEKRDMCEEVMLVYINELITGDKLKPTTVWSRYSMLKSTLLSYENLDVKKYEKVSAFMKKQAKGYRPKKAKIFTADDITKFCTCAPDFTHLVEKVVMILGMSGGLRRAELYDLVVENVKEDQNTLTFSIPTTKTGEPKSFVVMGELRNIVEKYRALRPTQITTSRFLINYQKGKCTTQVIGINNIGAMPRKIAEYLKLPDPKLYTGHSFRRTSATLLVDAGADITELKRFGGWKSTTVAESYLGESTKNKKRTYSRLTESINVKELTSKKKSQSPIPPTASTSQTIRMNASTSNIGDAVSLSRNKENIPSPGKSTCVYQVNNCTVDIVHNGG